MMVSGVSELERFSGFIPGYNIRTDLAVEAHEVLSAREEIPGVQVSKEGDEDITFLSTYKNFPPPQALPNRILNRDTAGKI
jgi:hypothetical protein